MFTDLLLLIGGLAAVASAAVIYCRKFKRYRHWLKASGFVLELISKWRERGGTEDGRILVYSPRVSFGTVSGEVVEFTSKDFSTPAFAQVGETVQVLYDPAHPEGAELDSFLFRHMQELFFLVVGLSLISIVVYGHYAA